MCACIQCSLIISISHSSIHWNIADLSGVTHLKKTDFLSTTMAPHLGERGSWAPPNSMLECWVVWSCVDSLDVVQAATAAMSSWMQLQKIQMPVRLLFPCVLSCLTKSWIQPLSYKELIDWLKFSILIALMEGLAPKSSSSGKGWGGYLSVLYDNKMAFNMQTNTCCCNSPTPHPQLSFPMEGFDCIFSELMP